VEISLATPFDWETCKRLRTEALNSKDGNKFGATEGKIREEEAKSEQFWRQELARPDMFIVLARTRFGAVGMGLAEQQTEDIWKIGWGYVEEGSRRQGIGKKLIAERLNRILQKQGIFRIEASVEISNKESLSNCESFGFKRADQSTSHISRDDGSVFEYFPMELNVTNPEVRKKLTQRINEVLNAG
jgi:ribosomal protein S18 acetylase RimI-like enzyme